MKGYLYRIYFEERKYFYVGTTDNYDRRIKRHIYDLEKDQHHCCRMQQLYSKGMELDTHVEEFPDYDSAKAKEANILAHHKNSDQMLNISVSVKGGDTVARNTPLKPSAESFIRLFHAGCV